MSKDNSQEHQAKPLAALKKLAAQARPEGIQVQQVNARLEELPGVRGQDGRTMRRTGRDVQFNTNIAPDLRHWLKLESARIQKPIGRLLELMRESYERENREGK